MAERELRVVILGDSASAERAFGRLDASVDDTGANVERTQGRLGRFGPAIAAGAAVGAAALVAFAGSAIDAAAEAQKVAAQTDAVIKSTGGAARVTAEEVGNLAGELQDLSGVEGEAIQAGQNMLLTFCLEESAEALTRRGWVAHTDLRSGDEILTYDPDDDSIRWDTVDSMHRFVVDGDLIRWRSKQIDVATTPHHRWWTTGTSGLSHYEPQFRTTEQISGHQVYVQIGGGTSACFPEEPTWSDELVELAGWIVTEGWVTWARPSVATRNQAAFSQSATANPVNVKGIRDLLDRLRRQGHRITEREDVAAYNGSTMVSWYFARDLGATVRAMLPGKKLTADMFGRLTERQARLLMDTLLLGDGSRDRAGHDQYIQKDPGQLDMIAMLAAMLGVRTSVLGRGDSIYLCSSNRLVGSNVNATKEHYRGTVWCPAIRTGIFLARNNGRTFWTGNTNIRNEAGKGNDVFNQATATLLDMSVALGTDAKTSAIQLGKALNDPIAGISALSRVGVTFTQEQKDTIATMVEMGDTAGAQKVILAELNKEFGGSAKAAGDALTPLDRLRLKFGDFEELAGGKILSFLEDFEAGLEIVVGSSDRFFDRLGRGFGKIGDFSRGVGQFLGDSKKAEDGAKDLGGAAKDAAGGIGDVGDASAVAAVNLEVVAATTKEAEEAAAEYAKALDRVLGASESLIGSQLSVADSIDGLRDSAAAAAGKEKELADAIKAHGRNSDQAKAAGEALADARRSEVRDIDSLAKAQATLAETQATAGRKTFTATDKYNAYRDSLIGVKDTIAPGSPLRLHLEDLINNTQQGGASLALLRDSYVKFLANPAGGAGVGPLRPLTPGAAAELGLPAPAARPAGTVNNVTMTVNGAGLSPEATADLVAKKFGWSTSLRSRGR